MAAKVDSRLIASGFTALYVAVALLFGPLLDRGSWLHLGRIVLLSLAGLSIGVLWSFYAIFRLRLNTVTLLAAGALCPVLVTVCLAQALSLVRGASERKTARQVTASRIVEVTDELLLGSKGNPIGVRVRYRVRYGEGLDDLGFRPFATLHVDEPSGNLWESSESVAPEVTGAYLKADYEFTDDYVPSFLPRGFLFAHTVDPCFRWSTEAERARVLGSPAQRFSITIQPYRYEAKTTNSYALRTFYEGALKEGAMECR
jgi:hypothetical protein